MICPKCNSEVPEIANFCPYCSSKLNKTDFTTSKELPFEPVQIKKQKKKKGKAKIIVGILIALIAIIGIIVFTTIYNNPLIKLESGFTKLIKANNFTIKVDGEIWESESLDAQVIYSKDELLYFDYDYDNDIYFEGGIYENNLIISSDANENSNLRIDLTDHLNEGKLDFSSLKNLNEKDENFIIGESISSYVNLNDCNEALDILKAGITEYLQNEKNLKHKIKEDGDITKYEFELDVRELYDIAYDALSPALSPELKEEFDDYLDADIKYNLKYVDATLTINMTGREISSADILIDYENDTVAEFTITVSDVNETTTSSSAKDLADLKKDCQTPDVLYKAMIESSRKNECIANQRGIISILTNSQMSEAIEFKTDTVFKIVYDEAGATYEFVSGDLAAFKNVPTLFSDIPYCPEENSIITVTVDVTASGYYYTYYNITVETRCSKHGDMYNY